MKILKVSGKDAGDFLHRVTAGRVKAVGVGQGAGGLLLNGQSRMIAQFDLLRPGASEYLLVSPEECFTALYEGLEKLHFAEDLTIEALRFAAGVKQEGEAGFREKIFSFSSQGEEFSWPAPVPGFMCRSGLGEAFSPNWEFERIGAEVPWPPMDWDSATPALEAAALQWIDRDKGCYPGQEVVELSLNVGHPARVLVAQEGSGSIDRGAKMELEGGGEGKVTSVAVLDGKTRIFIRVPWARRQSAIAGFRVLTKG